MNDSTDGYRQLLAALSRLPTQYLRIVTKIVTLLTGNAIFGQRLEGFLAEESAIAALRHPLTQVEGEYRLPALAAQVVDLHQVPGISMDEDYYKWRLEGVSPASEECSFQIEKTTLQNVEELFQSADQYGFFTQAQLQYVIENYGDRICKVMRGGVFFLVQVSDDGGATHEVYSFKLIGLVPTETKIRIAVRQKVNSGNKYTPLKGAYTARMLVKKG